MLKNQLEFIWGHPLWYSSQLHLSCSFGTHRSTIQVNEPGPQTVLFDFNEAIPVCSALDYLYTIHRLNLMKSTKRCLHGFIVPVGNNGPLVSNFATLLEVKVLLEDRCKAVPLEVAGLACNLLCVLRKVFQVKQ